MITTVRTSRFLRPVTATVQVVSSDKHGFPDLLVKRSFSNMGGFYIIAEFENDSNKKMKETRIKFGFAYCELTDNFDREIGARLATNMMNDPTNKLKITYDRELSIVDNFIRALEVHKVCNRNNEPFFELAEQIVHYNNNIEIRL